MSTETINQKEKMTISMKEHWKKIYESKKQTGNIAYSIFLELHKELSDERICELMHQGFFNAGKKASQDIPHMPTDMNEFKELFFSPKSEPGNMYSPEFLHCDADILDVRLHSCPVKEAWVESGATDEEVVKMCKLADGITFGLLDDHYEITTEYPKTREDVCVYHFSPKKKS